jgi:hypothetical protein
MTIARESVADLVIRYLVILVQPLGHIRRAQWGLRWTPALVEQPSRDEFDYECKRLGQSLSCARFEEHLSRVCPRVHYRKVRHPSPWKTIVHKSR